jgi:hypothetical protein
VVTTMPKRSALPNPDCAGDPLLVFGGVDTYADTHTVAAISHLGEMLGTRVSLPPRRATGSSTGGLPVTAQWSGSEWKGPAPTAPGLPQP